MQTEKEKQSDKSERCLVGISTHIAKAIVECNKALNFSMEEGSDHIETALCEVITQLESAETMNLSCGRVWDQ